MSEASDTSDKEIAEAPLAEPAAHPTGGQPPAGGGPALLHARLDRLRRAGGAHRADARGVCQASQVDQRGALPRPVRRGQPDPGPNSTQLAIYLGYLRAGWPGLFVAGACFILPAMAIVLALAWVYVDLSVAAAGRRLLYGVKPVVIAVIVQALVGPGTDGAARRAAHHRVGLALLALYLLGVNDPRRSSSAARFLAVLASPFLAAIRRRRIAAVVALVCPAR